MLGIITLINAVLIAILFPRFYALMVFAIETFLESINIAREKRAKNKFYAAKRKENIAAYTKQKAMNPIVWDHSQDHRGAR